MLSMRLYNIICTGFINYKISEFHVISLNRYGMKRQNIEKKDLKFLSDILNPNGLIGSPILVGKLFYLLRQENPQFDHHSYGYKTFKDLLEAQSNINLSWRQLANGEKS